MIIGLRGGHSKNCVGAVGIVNEYEQMQEFFKHISRILTSYGHTVIDCNSNGCTANAELSEGAEKANNANVDLFISLHMNAFNGTANGTEALVSSENSKALSIASKLCENFSQLGFRNRGVKFQKLYEMNQVNAPNIIFEICFCDSQKDISIYNQYSWDELAYRVCNAIDSNILIELDIDTKGYVVTNYLPPDSANYDGVNINNVLKYFDGITCYARGNNKGIWIETQYLPLSKCNELKNALGTVFYEIKK
ncbi:N-acetylmuramoyl-L-alanine amidase [Clostridium beijerinckii]|uniref:N-acetylmuramoyl-L-alanine amidase n=1 Tax=Clostridium beijerinckii TaxID=1520 RepID=UPI00149402AF|nr:N-acetylmuramoyl-L-alanine amidase [Clostridium beijerinckii]NOW86788.1 N-acetylmuramoyl-L-alanine amidase [Clostridium beijerinckii]